MKTAVLTLFLTFTIWKLGDINHLLAFATTSAACKQVNLKVNKTACAHKLNRKLIYYAMQFATIASGSSWGLLSVFEIISIKLKFFVKPCTYDCRSCKTLAWLTSSWLKIWEEGPALQIPAFPISQWLQLLVAVIISPLHTGCERYLPNVYPKMGVKNLQSLFCVKIQTEVQQRLIWDDGYLPKLQS